MQTVAQSHYLRSRARKRRPRYSDGMLPGSRGAERVHPNMILAVLSLAGAVYALLSSAVIPAFKGAHSDFASTARQPIVSMGDRACVAAQASRFSTHPQRKMIKSFDQRIRRFGERLAASS